MDRVGSGRPARHDVVVLRPEPGNARTAARAAARGFAVRRLPLFETRAVAWAPPNPAGFDALLLTSAAAVRHAGSGLSALAGLPVVAIGAETAAAATNAGLAVVVTGDAGALAALDLARSDGLTRLLHLAGRERMPDQPGVNPIVVYAGDALPIAAGAVARLSGWTALLHSPRAARRFAELADADRARSAIGVAALSPAILAAAGGDWAFGVAASAPTDDALLGTLLDALAG